MIPRLRFPLIGLAFLFLALPCIADDVEFALGQRMLGMTDAYRAPGQTEGFADGIYRLAPEVRVTGDNQFFGYEAWYAPIYSQYIRASSRSGLDHFFGARMDIRLTPVDKLNLSFQLQDIQGNRTNIDINPDGSTEFVNSNLGKTFVAVANIRYEHSLSPRTQLIGTLGYQEYDYTNVGNTDNRSLSLAVQAQHSLSPRLLLGANISGNYRVFLGENGDAFRYQTTFNPNAVLRYVINPAWQISATAGPSVIFTRQRELSGTTVSRFGGLLRLPPGAFYLYEDDCETIGSPSVPGLAPCDPSVGETDLPPNYPGEAKFVYLDTNANPFSGNTNNLTYFMQAGITRETPQLFVELAYQRREDASQGASSSTFLDVVFLNVLGEVGPKWTWRINSGWNRRVSSYFQPLYFVYAEASEFAFLGPGTPTPIAQSKELGVQQIETFYETSQIWAEGEVFYRILEDLNVSFRLRYERWLTLDLTTGPRPTWDNLTGQIGFKYYFDPIFF